MLLPLYGVSIFLFLYVLAALLYPGGSQFDKHSTGFSLTQNYWCNLLNERAINGHPNPARPIAIAAMFVLCITLALFWYFFPAHLHFKRRSRLSMQLSGLASMITVVFLFTGYHDMVITIASLFGLIALSGTMAGLYKLGWKSLFRMGWFNIILVALNNLLYYNTGLNPWLPLVQKITFLSFLLWLSLICIKLYRKTQNNGRYPA